MSRKLAVVVALFVAVGSVTAEKPDWAKPLLKRPTPQGSYITDDDKWVILRSEIEVGVSRSGGLSRSYRQVLAPTGDEPRKLTVALQYDDAAQELVEPTVWVPGGSGYKQLNLLKRGVDAAKHHPDTITSGRALFITTKEIRAGKKAIVSWQVIDNEAFPAEDALLPFDVYPTAELVVRREPEAALHLWMMDPAAENRSGRDDDEFVLRDLPALHAFYDGGDPWTPTPLSALPHLLVQAGDEPRSWEELAARTAALFRESLDSDNERSWIAKARQLTAVAEAPAERVATLAAFVQSLPYRDVAWGIGAVMPESPSETLRSMSADCKGKALLLQALLSEVGVQSKPVLCHAGPQYQRVPTRPAAAAFNHIVLAYRPTEDADLAATLIEGPGKGWVLFDPTDPLSTLGRPPANLEGSQALWVDGNDGELFTVRTREPGRSVTRVELGIWLEDDAPAGFDLVIEGRSGIAALVSDWKIYEEDAGVFRQRCQRYVQSVAPGLVVNDALFLLPDHQSGRPARLQLLGRIPTPLQSVGGEMHTLSFPTALLGLALDVPVLGYARPFDEDDAEIELPAGWRPEPCCQASSSVLDGEITLSLPSSWAVRARPSIDAIDAPWIRVEVGEADGWTVRVELPRGEFASGSATQRLEDLNALASLFRQPFLLAISDQAPAGR